MHQSSWCLKFGASVERENERVAHSCMVIEGSDHRMDVSVTLCTA